MARAKKFEAGKKQFDTIDLKDNLIDVLVTDVCNKNFGGKCKVADNQNDNIWVKKQKDAVDREAIPK